MNSKYITIFLLASLTIAAICLVGVEADVKVSSTSTNTSGCKTTLCKIQRNVQLIASKFTVRQVLVGIVIVLASIALQQQYTLLRKKGNLPGPSFVPPFFGMLFQLILTPFSFYENQEKYGPISWTSIMNKFVLFVTDAETTRQVFKEKNAKLYLSLGAKKILTEKAIPFIEGTAHQQLRKQLLPLFTIRALSSYLPIQETIIQEHITAWMKEGGNINAREKCRDLNMAISTGVFVGQKTPLAVREEIARNFFVMNDGFLCFPIDLPGTTLRKAINARERLVEIFTDVIKNSRTRMESGEKPESLIDLWVEYYLGCDESERDELSDETIIFTLLSFMFASQDAMTSSLVWVVRLLGEHKDVLAKVREEQFRLRPSNDKLDLETMRQAMYTRQVVNEILRFRPPAVMVPHENVEDIVIGDNVVVPKGTMILPSIWSAHFAEGGFKDAHTFDPERFNSERKEEITCAKNYLVFGAGPHYCIGRELAKNQIEIFLTQLAMNYDWELNPTQGGDEIIFGPTIFPKDGCNASLKVRTYSA
ncbi:cytochrome P450 family protein [Heterostelium album PN500]|uniref:Cytochrome P450 family protein n=1 Tax=Heterostelium pallidum (strain ATCC 26659 / Pp 5 / PN500) TaxID=670386 RepID=D3BGE3_HETP5|nr:cytochrome P450 family protein [Heterostelium album PN500]EFA79543.1 cytochrome P450 family protein [Heterostelium album PN500]|eukprot:XP_020431664.1 cytochrome P450 family protein [Heterostelium album PN500]